MLLNYLRRTDSALRNGNKRQNIQELVRAVFLQDVNYNMEDLYLSIFSILGHVGE